MHRDDTSQAVSTEPSMRHRRGLPLENLLLKFQGRTRNLRQAGSASTAAITRWIPGPEFNRNLGEDRHGKRTGTFGAAGGSRKFQHEQIGTRFLRVEISLEEAFQRNASSLEYDTLLRMMLNRISSRAQHHAVQQIPSQRTNRGTDHRIETSSRR